MTSPEYQKLRRLLKPGLAVADDPTQLVREKMIAIHPTGCSDATEVTTLELAGVPCAWVQTAEAQGQDRVVFFAHGGAFVSTGLAQYELYAENVSRAARARVLIYEYALAPEQRFPVPLDQGVAIYREAVLGGMRPERTAFMGDSCGGGIALSTLCRLRDAGDPLPACFAGLTPWFDAKQQGDAACHPRGIDPFVNADWIRKRFEDYVGPGGDLSDPMASPIGADLRGLPPLYLGVGEIDTTSDDSTRLAASAARAGVSVVLDVSAEMIHGFHGLCGAFPEATDAMQRVGDFVRRHIP